MSYNDDAAQYSVYSYALLQAAAQADIEAVAECIAHNAYLDVLDPTGKTPLMLVSGRAYRSARSVAEMLISCGANTAHHDARNRVAAHEAASAGNDEVLQLLKAAGAPLDALDVDLNTPLHLTSSPRCTALLLQSGARSFVENRSGNTPMMEAVLRNDLPCVEAHIQYGARPLARCRDGASAVSIAWARGFRDMLNLLYRFSSPDGSGDPAQFDAWLRAALQGTPDDPALPSATLETRSHGDALPLPTVARIGVAVAAADPDPAPGSPIHPYYDPSALAAALASPMDDERPKYLKKMRAAGHLRVLSRIPEALDFEVLHRDFPNFVKVTEFIEKQVALCRLSEHKVAAFQPVMLLGDPGVGKTRYLIELTKLLNLEFTLIQCGGVSANFVLSGSTTSWKNGKPGKIHVALRDGRSANPVIMLDEIDKLAGSHEYDAHGPLYQLLEKKTASGFQDECIEVPMDCSAIIWVATANNLNAIPEAIVSRLKVIEVPAPTGEGLIRVARSVYRDILDEHGDTWGGRFVKELPEELLSRIGDQTPREIRRCLLGACGKAALRHEKAGADAPLIALSTDDVLDHGPLARTPMGFAR